MNSSEKHRLVLATSNREKLRELVELLNPIVPGFSPEMVAVMGDYDIPDVRETGVTFTENALLKARAVCAATGLPALADDSGLCVDVMGGAPGILSARWAGRHGDDQANLELLLNQLADIEDPHRGAAFVCAAVIVTPDGTERHVVEEMRGRLLKAPRGENGFGYDPIFQPEGYTVSNAELQPAEKNRISHRGKAMRALAPVVATVIELTRR